MQPADVTAKCEPLVKQLRAAHPETPILLVEDRPVHQLLDHSRRRPSPTMGDHAALKAAYARLQAAGVKNLHDIAGDSLDMATTPKVRPMPAVPVT